ncbi:alpha-(1-_3)-arabinofuranosyltransferase domain-containing protein, partial [Actinomadura kijaniata]|uniref:alpha-(1->3)-arabinofuranosyltransferase domain-containing protein n=1 Tax=Actinomadura kijaniata TaxID=46161 RepID=UPI0031CE2924
MAIGAWADRLARRVSAADRAPAASRDAAPDPEGADPVWRDRLRVLVCCLALTVLAVTTRPGRVLADTKIDMAVSPAAFLGRALHLWDTAQFGQLQNQAAGYFFPWGPFHLLGDLAGLPAWITQRMWMALLMCAAFLGARRLADRLGLGGPVSRLFGGMAYALGPHGLSALGQNSWEYLPLALLPWTVIPLVTAVRNDGGRARAAARSGVAIALCGGINGTATVAVLAVPALYLVTRRRPRLLAWWLPAVLCAVAWWLVPLVLTGRYAFSWLGYTEKADTTTASTGLLDVLRGAERWINYLGGESLPVGHLLASRPALIVATVLLAALGLVGLARRDLPERTFLLLTLLAGLAVVTAGHASAVEGPLAPVVRDLLDGPLAPLRNLYKFDGLVRLPLALGLAHLPGTLRRPRVRLTAFALAAATLAAVASPGLTNGLAGPGDFPDVPRYWRDAANWLNGRAGQQAVLAVPGARFGDYTWGRPMDDVVQPLLRTRWGARQLVPQGSPGYARIVDALDQRIAAGRGSPGLTATLARMGVRYLLVRNDLSRWDLRGAWPARVQQALLTSPGITRVAAFGTEQAVGWGADDAVGAFDQRYPPVEIYEVADADDVVGLLDAERPLRVRGAPEALLGLADNGALRGRPVLVGDDDPHAPADTVSSDALRWRERGLGEIRTLIGPTMTADRPRADTRGRGADPEEAAWRRDRTVAEYTGVRDVTASASASDPGSITGLDDPGALPYAALDRDPGTRWITGGWSGPVGQWLRVDLAEPRDPGTIEVTFVRNEFLGPPPARVAVETRNGVLEQPVTADGRPQRLTVPPGRTDWLRLRVTGLARRPESLAAARVAVAELAIPGVRATRHLRLPRGGTAQVMTRSVPPRPECMRGAARVVCSPELGRGDEDGATLNRVFTAGAAADTVVTGRAVLRDPALIDRLTRGGSRTTVTASSVWTREPPGMPRSAFDGDEATAWVADGDDRAPTLRVAWGSELPVGEVTVVRPPGAGEGLRLTVTGARGEAREGLVDKSGRLRFEPLRTDRLTLRFDAQRTPVQVGEVRIPGVPALTGSGFEKAVTRCGDGPVLEVNGARIRTRMTVTVDDLVQGRAMPFRSCGPVPVVAGDNRISAGGDRHQVDSLLVDPGGRLGGAPARSAEAVRIESWGRGSRKVEVTADRRSYLVVNENFNAGWRARTATGRELRPVRLDGWRQAWEVPAGTTGLITIGYGPDLVYRLSLLAGLVLLLGLLTVAARPTRAAPAPPAEAPRGRWPTPPVLVLAAVLGFWLAGFVGLAVTPLAAAVPCWALDGDLRAPIMLARLLA